MKAYHYYPLVYCRVWLLLLHSVFGVFILVSIGSDMLISIFNYSDSVSWKYQNSRKMATDP